MIRKTKKDKMSWVFNHADARKAIIPIGARNLTFIEAIFCENSEKEEVVETYSNMIMYASQQADQEVILWMKKLVKRYKGIDERALYFRFARL